MANKKRRPSRAEIAAALLIQAPIPADATLGDVEAAWQTWKDGVNSQLPAERGNVDWLTDQINRM